MPMCGAETHLFSSHPTIDASEASASRAWGPCRPVSPNKDSIKASHETRNRPEECLDSAMAGRPRALLVTKRHKTPRFARGRYFIDVEHHLETLIALSSFKSTYLLGSTSVTCHTEVDGGLVGTVQVYWLPAASFAPRPRVCSVAGMGGRRESSPWSAIGPSLPR